MISGHQMLASRTFGLAGAYYLKALEHHQDNSMLHLCLGVVSLLRSMQRLSHNRHAQIAEAFAFLYHYCNLRGRSQEALYNIGRAYQHLGLYNVAIESYKEALRTAVGPQESDFSYEAAYNLHLIYVNCGAPQLAARAIETYLVV